VHLAVPAAVQPVDLHMQRWIGGKNMKAALDTILRTVIFGSTVLYWLWLPEQRFSNLVELLLIVGCVVLVVPFVSLGRILLGRDPAPRKLAWVTTFVHFSVLSLLGTAIIRAVVTYRDWTGWIIPIPAEIGRLLTIVTGVIAALTVLNLAMKGLGAPFAIALTRRLAADWMYAWTRNPMVFASLCCLVSLGLYFRSALFVIWALALVTPAFLVFLKVYEERELELRFGKPYLKYKARTPMLIPRKPRG
jgi:protein-S-isoprenylcysteine O-methyltransferase Ste14